MRQTARGGDASLRMGIARNAAPVESEDADEVPLAQTTPVLLDIRRHVCVRGQLQRQQVVRGSGGDGLFVEPDGGVAWIAGFDVAVEKHGRQSGEQLLRQLVVVHDAAVGLPELNQLRHLLRAADICIGELYREAVSLVEVRRVMEASGDRFFAARKSQNVVHGGQYITAEGSGASVFRNLQQSNFA